MSAILHSKPDLTPDDFASVERQLQTGRVGEGSGTIELEQQFRKAIDVRSAFATGSGSQALLLALRAADVQPGDEVIMPAYVCAEVLAVTLHLAARPVIVDVAEDYLLDVEATSKAISPQTKALILPYTLGIFRDPTPFAELGVTVIEDCAQFVDPTPYRVSRILGQLAVYSFEGTKIMTSGEGGMVVTDDAVMSEHLAEMKRFGGSNFKLNLFPLSDLQASLASSQLARLSQILARRMEIAQTYFAALADLPNVQLPSEFRERSLFFRFPIQLKNMAEARVDRLMDEFGRRGVIVRRPVTPLLNSFVPPFAPTPTAIRLQAETISIPLYPALRDAEVDQVIDVTRHVLR